MATLGRAGTGFSSNIPGKSVDTIAGLKYKKRSSGRSSRSSRSISTVKVSGNTVFINGKGFSVRLQDQASFIQSQTGGYGSSASNAIKAAKKAALAKAQKAAVAAAKANLEKALALKEAQRLATIKKNLLLAGARRNIKTSVDARTGDKLQITTIKKNGQTIRETKNITQNFTRTNYFAPGRAGGSVAHRGGVVVGSIKKSIVVGGKSVNLGDVIVPRAKEKNVVKKSLGGFVTGVNQNTRNEITRLARKNKRTFVEQAKILGFEFFIPFQELAIGVTALPAFGKSLIADPKSITKVPGLWVSGLKQSGLELFALAKISPTRAIARIGGEVVLIVSGGKALKVGGKFTGKVANRLNPFLKRVKNGKIIVRGAPSEIFMVKGKVRMLKTRVKAPSIKRPFSSVSDFLKGRKPGQFKKFTKDPGLALKLQTVKSGATPLSKQALLAGQEVTAVNAAVDQITSWIKRKKIVRKPIPGEVDFPVKIKGLLKKFDSGKKLTTREFAQTNLWLQKNVAPNITLLERSLYLDPASGLRVSRLGIQAAKDATLRDILKGNFRLWNKAGKPQILVFENAKVAKLPKSLSVVKRKLIAGKKLSVAETNKLIEWQVKSGSGKFKPIGSTIYQGGIELEVTLAPGELIKRIKRIGTVVIEGKRVSIVSAEVFKPSKKLLIAMKKANLGKLSKTQVSSLEKSLAKKLGRKIRIETPSLKKVVRRSVRRADASIPVLRVKGGRILVARLLGGAKRIIGRFGKRKVTKRVKTARKTTTIKPVKRTKTAKRTTKKVKRPVKRVVSKRTNAAKREVRATPRGVRSKAKTKPVARVRVPKGFTQKTLKKKVNTFYVVEKVRGKLKKLYPKPLKLQHARDLAVYQIDHRLSRTAFFVPLGKNKKVSTPPKSIIGYYSKNKFKVRPYRVKFGKKKVLVNGYIEKRKYIQDLRNEKAQMRNARKKKTIIKRGKKNYIFFRAKRVKKKT